MKQILIQTLRLQIQASLNKTKMKILATVVKLLTAKHQFTPALAIPRLAAGGHAQEAFPCYKSDRHKFERSLPAKVYQCLKSLEERQHKNQ